MANFVAMLKNLPKGALIRDWMPNGWVVLDHFNTMFYDAVIDPPAMKLSALFAL